LNWKRTVFYLGLHLIVAALVFGVIIYYYAYATVTVTAENVTAEPFTFRMRALETIYPLRGWHFLAYVFLVAGVAMMLGSRYIKSVKT